ncbi:hypothetical protein JAAARDRAFT_209320 [Jaapia argillacea MUCL 33604]|uniref:MICOS complex subunit n=1 Tax=Jaapia argillacea MUCL 33604 TaxID=933084 RepID=A0A067PTK9_9AGAM|nr:hypothetical protein JAAARDRAFT_209320 [Jaapia argillacea MUCL 33604]
MNRLRMPRTVLAASALALASTHEPAKEKLLIYPLPEAQILVVDEPSELEKQIGDVRRKVTGAYLDAHASVQGVVSRWIGVEHAVESRIKSLLDPTEEITPGLLYTTIATLSTSIVTRSRGLPTRLILPPTAFLVSLSYFLPKTSSNVSDYYEELEDRFAPTFGEKRRIGVAHSAMAVDRVKDSLAGAREGFGKGVGNGVDWVQGLTGLKIREALGWSEGVLHQTEIRTKEVGSAVGKLLEKDENLAKAFARDVKRETVERLKVGKEDIRKMLQTDESLVAELVEGVGKETVERVKVGKEEVVKLAETDKELVGKNAEEFKETTKAEAKKLV